MKSDSGSKPVRATTAQTGVVHESHGAKQSPNIGSNPETPDIELLRERGEKLARWLGKQGYRDWENDVRELTRLRTLPAPSEAGVERVAAAMRPNLFKMYPNGQTERHNELREMARAAILAMQEASK